MSGTAVRSAGALSVAPAAETRAAERWTWFGRSVDGRARRRAIIAAFGLVALGVQLFALSRHGYLRGITEYDDAVYLGAASRLVHGVLPYRNFAFVAPPGVPVLMTPVAFIGRLIGVQDAMVLARLVTAAVTAANVVLLGLLLRHRNIVTIVVACGVLAAYPATILSGRTLLLEPYLVLFCLVGALFVFRGEQIAASRSVFFGGLAFGAAGAIKIWAIVPVAAIVLVCLPAFRRRVLPLLVGAAASFGVVCLPFFAAAPGAFVRQVVVVQLERSELARTPVWMRLWYLTGLAGTTFHLTTKEMVAVAAAAGMIVVLLFVVTKRRLSPLERFGALSVIAISASFFWPDAFYYHYAAFLAPFLALVIGSAVGRLADQATSLQVRGLVMGAVALAAAINLNGVAFAARQTTIPAPDPAAVVDLTIPVGACVVSDTTAFLVNANRFEASSPSCPDVVDPLGATLALNDGRRPSGDLPDSSPAVQGLLSDLARADFLILSDDVTERWPWTPTVAQYIESNFVVVPVAGPLVYQRIGPT
jgi:hypothetical protein